MNGNEVAIYSVLPNLDEVGHFVTFLDFDNEGEITNHRIVFGHSFTSVFSYDIIPRNDSNGNHE